MDENLFAAALKDATPAMNQYLTVKGQYQDCLIFFRMGDFFELFFDDAKVASSILNIALTHRGKSLGQDIPMCGIPVAALDNYVERLVKEGQRVVICDQIEEPEEARKRGYKAVIKREVTRVITSGTLIEENLLSAAKNNFLMALTLCIDKKSNEVKTVSFAVIDISTGDFFINTVLESEFSAILNVYNPKEILMPSIFENTALAKKLNAMEHTTITVLPISKFNPITEKERVERYFQVRTLDSFGQFSANELSVCGAIIEYLQITQRDNFSSLPIPKKNIFSNYLIIDPATNKSLEIVSSLHGEYKYSLLGALDETKTAFGARMLAARISMPIINREILEKRLDCIEFFLKKEELTRKLREILAECPDFERVINRIKFKKFSPRDLGDVRTSLSVLDRIKNELKDETPPAEDEYTISGLANFSSLQTLLINALVEKLPQSGYAKSIRAGYSQKLDELNYYKSHSEEMVIDLQNKYMAQTGIATLRIKSNNVLGWFIEIPASQRSKMPPQFIHRQTLTGNVRYITQEVMDMQEKLSKIYEEIDHLEKELYDQIVDEILKHYEALSYAVKFLAHLDVYANFAHIALERNYTRPEISEDPVLEVKGGCHPVLALYEPNFTANDCDLTKNNRVCLLTGPNMAGKSTYLRQNALLVIMAQIGSFVPAASARIGIVDRLFSRIGASDDISRGRSTFMVEMIETATILNQATKKSFVILDEVGRGTSTYDGLSIAWAVIEHLYEENKCRVLFATHYHELTALQKSLTQIICKTLKVQEWHGDVIFYHKIIDGTADKSYGIHVAKLAGVPLKVITRAKDLLKKFESRDGSSNATAEMEQNTDDLSQMELIYVNDSPLREKLNSIDLNNLTPKMALDILYELKK